MWELHPGHPQLPGVHVKGQAKWDTSVPSPTDAVPAGNLAPRKRDIGRSAWGKFISLMSSSSKHSPWNLQTASGLDMPWRIVCESWVLVAQKPLPGAVAALWLQRTATGHGTENTSLSVVVVHDAHITYTQDRQTHNENTTNTQMRTQPHIHTHARARKERVRENRFECRTPGRLLLCECAPACQQTDICMKDGKPKSSSWLGT